MGAEAPSNVEGHSATGVQDPNAGLSAADQASVNTMMEKVRTKQGVIFPDGNVNKDLYKQVQADRVKENLEWLEQMERFSGSNPNGSASTVDLGGGFSLTGRMAQSPRHQRDTRYIGSAGKFSIIEANENILDDANRRLNKIANRIEKSKFACGHFDWVVQLRGKFNKAALEKYVDKLAESALAAAPMALLANLSPTLYEIVKFLRMTASMELDADKLRCDKLEEAFTDVGRRMTRGDGYAACIQANQGLGVSEAHRICNSGDPSPFDGVENVSGKIVGLNANNPDINLTQVLADKLSSPKGPDDVAAEQQLKASSAKLAAANAALASSPDPGDPPTNAQAGSDEMIKWQEAANKHANAVNAVENATGDVEASTSALNSNGSDLGIWKNLGNAVASNLGNIIGDMDLSTKTDIQFGRQRQYQLLLKYKHQGYLLSLDFCTQLEHHYSLLIAGTRDTDAWKDSYEAMQAFCFGSFKAPWLDWNPVMQLDPKTTSLDVRFGYDTLNKLSVLWTTYKGGNAGSISRTVWAEKYRTVECINAISTFEMFDYLWKKSLKDKDTIMQELSSMSTTKQPGSGERIIKQVTANLDDYTSLMQRKRDEALPILVQCIYAVNKFQLNQGKKVLDENGIGIPPLERSQLGR